MRSLRKVCASKFAGAYLQPVFASVYEPAPRTGGAVTAEGRALNFVEADVI